MKWGSEYGLGGNKSGTAEFRNRLTAANIGQCFKGTDDAGLVYEAQENGHPDSVLIYRVSTAGQNDGNDYDTPFYQLHPKDAAAVHYGITTNKWPPELDPNRVYQEPINEPRAKPDPNKPNYNDMHPCDWLGEFMTEYAILANADGRKVCGPCFNSGEPEPSDYGQPGMLRWLNYCADNPEKAALSVHEYNFGSVPYADNYPWHYGRFQAAIAAADKAGIPRTFRIFITEWGWTLNTVPSWETAVPTIAAYSLLSARFPQLEAAAIWSLRAGWGGISDQLAAYISDNGNPFANWLINNQYPTETQPQATAPEFGSTLPAPPDNGGNDMTQVKTAVFGSAAGLSDKTVTGLELQYSYKEDGALKWVNLGALPMDGIDQTKDIREIRIRAFVNVPRDEPDPKPPPVELTLPQGSKGVDLSNYQAGFFDLVDPDDFDFYIFRCSDGMNTSATSQNHDANGVDRSLWKFADVGHASGKPWGIYHFLRPGNVEAQISKVRFIYQQLIDRGTPPRTAVFDNGTPFTAVWCDFEDWNVSNAQVKQFCEGVDIATLTGIYSGQSIWNSKAAGVSIWWSDRPCWFADYGTNNGSIPNRNPLLLNGFKAGHIWQFSSQYGNEAGWKNDSLDINVVGPYYPENKPDPPTPPPQTGQTVDVLPWIRGPHRRQFDKEYKLSNGTTGTQTTQVFWLNEAGTDWLYIKGENGEYEHLGIRQWNGQPWIFRFEDTSEGPDRWYAHFMSSSLESIGAPWLPQFCEVEKWYETAKFVQHYSKDGTGKPICTKLNSGSVVDRLRIISEPYSRLYQSGKTEQVITAEWSAGEQYDFAGGNIAFRNSAGDNYWFMTWLEGRADKTYKKVECLNVGW